MLNKNKKNAVVTAFLSVLRKQILTIVLYLAETEGFEPSRRFRDLHP